MTTSPLPTASPARIRPLFSANFSPIRAAPTTGAYASYAPSSPESDGALRINLSAQFDACDSDSEVDADADVAPSPHSSQKSTGNTSTSSIDLSDTFFCTCTNMEDSYESPAASVAARARNTYKSVPKTCPPTPQRGPQWNKARRQSPINRLRRQNSLVATKLLFELQDEQETSRQVDHSSIAAFSNQRFLGSGASSIVYEATDDDGHRYAIKKSKLMLRGRRDREIHLREIHIYDMLVGSKPEAELLAHIVKYHRAWQEEGHIYIQTELCSQGTLEDVVKSGKPLPEALCWRVLHDVAKCLHSRNIVHLDIKPANLFVSDSLSIKIGDLGLAISLEKHEDDSGNEGDSCYLAPELLQTSSRRFSADIFSLGISIVELATGERLPSQGPSWHDLRNGMLPPSLISNYSKSFVALIKWMMAQEPTKRPTSKQLMAHPFVQDAGATSLAPITEYRVAPNSDDSDGYASP